MPDFLMHLTEGELILKKAGQHAHPYGVAARQFLLGCILPDITDDKEKTHFRSKSQMHQINKYPDLSCVMRRYEAAALSPIDLGILAHLHLDALYVTDFWPRYFEIQKKDGTPSTDLRNELYVKLFRQQGARIPLSDFFSMNYFYGDYDVINPALAHDFHPYLPTDVSYTPEMIHITECTPETPAMVNDMLQRYACGIRPAPEPPSGLPTKVFPYADVLAFLEQQADAFFSRFHTDIQSCFM